MRLFPQWRFLAQAWRVIMGVATPDWGDRLIQSEQVGGRAHAKRIHVVWSCGGGAYPNRRGDAFARDSFQYRRWQIKVLRC